MCLSSKNEPPGIVLVVEVAIKQANNFVGYYDCFFVTFVVWYIWIFVYKYILTYKTDKKGGAPLVFSIVWIQVSNICLMVFYVRNARKKPKDLLKKKANGWAKG